VQKVGIGIRYQQLKTLVSVQKNL